MNNTITVVGHVGQNPQSVSFEGSGNKVVKFSVAVKEFSSASEEDSTFWIDVDAWNGLGDRVMSTITSGREVAVSGRLALSKYTKEVNGVKVQMTKPLIKMTGFHLCGKRPVQKETELQTVNEAPAKSRKLATSKK